MKKIFLLQIIEYSIPRRKYTEFSKNLQGRLPTQWLARSFPITNISFDENNENIIIVHDDTTVFVINKCSDLPNSSAKIPKLENGDCREESSTGSSSHSQHAIQVVKKYKVVINIFFLYFIYQHSFFFYQQNILFSALGTLELD